ncbi:TPA: hypothetical protein G9252_002750 [Salmonella enterica subsp. enterica serovar Enteritidis]|nr:hypothetical protein [Salmonella enterica subsp. enterica serovar Enteritidis]
MSIKNDGHYFCRAGGNRPDGLNEPVTEIVISITIQCKMYMDKLGLLKSRSMWETGNQ